MTKNDFQFPQEANLFAGGTLGEHMSFLTEVTWAENPDGSSGTELEHAQLHINSPFGLDGDTTGVTLRENWRERSLRVGLLGYSGNGEGIDFPMEDASGMPVSIQDRTFNRAGVYGSWYFDDLNLFGVYLRGSDRLDTYGEDGTLISRFDGNYHTCFLQADYVILPPLQASLRYENLRPADQQAQSLRFLNASVSYFAYANVKVMLEYRRDLHESENYTLNTILRFAF